MLIGEGNFFDFKILLYDNLCLFDKSPDKYNSKTCQLEKKAVCSQQIFFINILFNTTALILWMIISLAIMEYDATSETQTLEKNGTVSILIYLCFSEAELGFLL